MNIDLETFIVIGAAVWCIATFFIVWCACLVSGRADDEHERLWQELRGNDDAATD
jgi:hypothetical protein